MQTALDNEEFAPLVLACRAARHRAQGRTPPRRAGAHHRYRWNALPRIRNQPEGRTVGRSGSTAPAPCPDARTGSGASRTPDWPIFPCIPSPRIRYGATWSCSSSRRTQMLAFAGTKARRWEPKTPDQDLRNSSQSQQACPPGHSSRGLCRTGSLPADHGPDKTQSHNPAITAKSTTQRRAQRSIPAPGRQWNNPRPAAKGQRQFRHPRLPESTTSGSR